MRRGIKCKMFREKRSRASGSGFRRLSRLFNSPIDGLAIRINDCLQQTRLGWVKGLARGRLDRRRADRSNSAAPIREPDFVSRARKVWRTPTSGKALSELVSESRG